MNMLITFIATNCYTILNDKRLERVTRDVGEQGWKDMKLPNEKDAFLIVLLGISNL